MKKYFSKTAVSLIELMVATVLMSIVLMGMFAINNALNNNNQDYGQRYLVRSATQTTLNHILNNASLAVGSVTTINGVLDQGIIIGTVGLGAGTNNGNSFCIHQAYNNNITGTNLGVGNDIWLCYTFYGAGAAVTATSGPNEVFYCTMPFTQDGTFQRGATNCSAVGNSQFLGTAYYMTNPVNMSTGPYYNPSFNPNVGFTLTIKNCLDDSNTTSCYGATPAPSSNPEVQVSGSIFPPQVSTH